jgi:hypothetical protein
MRYMVLLSMNENTGPPPQALVQAMNEAMGQAFASGVMVDAGGLGPTARSAEITLRGGTVLVTDGPFTEAKEVVGGYAVIEVRDHDEAVEQARRMIVIHQQFWPGWEGSAQVRPLSGHEEGPPSS